MTGAQRGNAWTGHYPGGLGAFTYVLEGNVAKCIGSFQELAELSTDVEDANKANSGNVKALVTFFEGLTATTCQSVRSLRYFYASPGDLVYTPPGSLVAEKVLNTDSVQLRFHSLIIHPGMEETVGFMDKLFPGTLGLLLRFFVSLSGAEPAY